MTFNPNVKWGERAARLRAKGIVGQELQGRRQQYEAAKAKYKKRQANIAGGNATAAILGKDNATAAAWLSGKLVPQGSFGRVDTGIQMDANGQPIRDANGNPMRIQENADVLSRYKDLADKGYDSQQFQALREQQQKGMNSALNTQLGQLAKSQARGRVYGASASAQQANALRADTQTRQDLEQQLFLKGADYKTQALGNYATSLSGMQENEFNRQKENLAAARGEIGSQLAAYFGTIAAGQTGKFNQAQIDLAKEALAKLS